MKILVLGFSLQTGETYRNIRPWHVKDRRTVPLLSALVTFDKWWGVPPMHPIHHLVDQEQIASHIEPRAAV